jgi:5-amino-6-(5-phospho-D-ribitylamino)uracil phosphatase
VAERGVTGLFVSDLDGTLVDRQARLSPYTRRHLTELLRSGLPFTVASARSIHTLGPILAGLPLCLPIAELNGAFITDLRTREPLVCHSLCASIGEAVVGWALESRLPPFVSTFSAGQQHLYPPVKLANAGIAWYDASRRQAKDARLRAARHPRFLLDQTIVCLMLIGKLAELSPVLAAIEARFPGQTQSELYQNRYQRGWHWLTVQSHLASKEHALRAIAESAGVGLAQTTVFGDEINDVPMFQVAGRAVAVGNAVPELKRIAHEVIGPHDQDSVIEYILAAR